MAQQPFMRRNPFLASVTFNVAQYGAMLCVLFLLTVGSEVSNLLALSIIQDDRVLSKVQW
jgi:hypothetical protein